MGNGKQKPSVSIQTRDVNSKEIFKNPTLCSQFLRNNVDIPQLKQVRPEDIEDVTERYQAYLGVEFEADTVKKIRLKDENGNQEDAPLYLVSLIEHKSSVDHDIMMQLLRYIVCIWHEYAKEMEREKKGISRQKGFRYPPVLPIVYYEGNDSWTAPQRLSERVWQSNVFGKYVPDFRYELVNIHDYSDQKLLERGDEMSLLMLLNKLQSPEDFRSFRQSPPEKLTDILRKADPHILKLMQDVMYSLMMKMNMPTDEADEYVKALRGEKQMGYLFENMQKMDIQAERRNTAEARKQAEEARRQADEAEQRADAAEKRADAAEKQADAAKKQADAVKKQADAVKKQADAVKKQADAAEKQAIEAQLRANAAQKQVEAIRKESEYKTYVTTCRDFNCTQEETANRFIRKFSAEQTEDPQEAMEWAWEKVRQYWDEA